MSAPDTITAEGLRVARGSRVVLRDASLTLQRGECVGLIGPNGAGKTTLLRALFGLESALGHSSLACLPAHTRARIAAYLPQGRVITWPVPVRDLIALGRLPHLDRGAALPREIALKMQDTIDLLGLADFAERDATSLSGGETARVLLARALVQDTPFIFADEPAAGLDPAHQISVMRLFHDLAMAGRGVVVTCHDLGLAARFCTRLVVMHAGQIVADGPPATVLTETCLAQVFGLRAQIQTGAQGVEISQMDITA